MPQSSPTPPEIDEVTPIEEGRISEKTKNNSKMFKEKRYDSLSGNKKLVDLANQRQRNVNVRASIGERIIPNSFSIDEYLRNISCNSDAIVIGSIKGKASQLIEDGTFIFTEYDFSVNEILKNNVADPFNINGEITIVRSGGAVKVNGKVISAIDDAEVPLKRNATYLIFLRYQPDTKSYKTFETTFADSSFQLNGQQVRQVSGLPLPFGAGQSAEAGWFINRIRVTHSQKTGQIKC